MGLTNILAVTGGAGLLLAYPCLPYSSWALHWMLLSSFNKAGVSVFILEKVASSCFPVPANLTSSCVSVSHFKGILTDLRSKLPSLAAYGVYLVARSLDSGVQPF